MKRSAVPYAPRRITPAGSVLIPLSPAEMEKYRNYSGGVGTMILRKKKRVENLLGDGPAKREREDPESEEGPRKKRRSGDVAVVVEHCLYISPCYPADVTGLTVSRLSRQRPTRRRCCAEAGIT